MKDRTTMGIELTDIQRQAVDLVCDAPLGIVTGGAGVGKTVSLRDALDRLDRLGVAYELASPTGKAAKRMTEATGRPARTVHRLLGYDFRNGERGSFDHCAAYPLETDVVIVDEASMLDIRLFDSLLNATPKGARLVLIGDANQLPSVGPGQVLRDLVDGGKVPVVRLDKVHRSAQRSWVNRNAPGIIDGAMPQLEECDDFRFVECGSSSDIARVVRDLVQQDPKAQVLTPQNTGPAGTQALNAALQNLINPQTSPSKWKNDQRELRLGDRVIQTNNNYHLGVFNGEVGHVSGLGDSILTVDYGDREVRYGRGPSTYLSLAYALTIHKQQGSETAHAIVVCHSCHSRMLTRQLLYTAVTRAQQRVTLVGDIKGIKTALERGAKPRNSCLTRRVEAML